MNIPSSFKTAARTALLGALALGALGHHRRLRAGSRARRRRGRAAAARAVDKGDTTWMLVSTILVLLMTIPGLALFYGGLVRAKNMLSVLMQVFTDHRRGDDHLGLLRLQPRLHRGGTSLTSAASRKLFLAGVDVRPRRPRPSRKGVVIPELVFVVFQMTFACITPALIVGAFAERIKFSAVMLFVVLWVTFVYFPIAHMVWFWGGPSAASDPTGLIFGFGAIDFAGGTVVHINAGIAGLVGAIMIGKRIGYSKDNMAPHSMTLTMVGASLLWVGWFGFNAGSNLEANGYAALAMINTFVATAAAALSLDRCSNRCMRGKASMLGAASGAVAGLVAVTPAAGFAGPMGAIVLGVVASVVCYFFVVGGEEQARLRRLPRRVRHPRRRRHHRRARHRHPRQPGARRRRHRRLCRAACRDCRHGGQVWTQIKGVLVTVLWSGIGIGDPLQDRRR